VAQEHHLSRAAYERLQAELEDLTGRGRVEIAQDIQRARELGDLSENGDYQAAKEHQGMMESRIRHLEALLKDAVIVEGGETDSVRAGCVVTLRYDGDPEDMTERYLIGSIEERVDDLEVISPGSPLGSALVGRRRGELVEFEAPNGALKVLVVDVES
jgi:transcription elongation factor GreA